MTLACWIWTIWTMLTTAAFLGYLPHFLSPEIWPSNVELSFYQVHCSCQNLPAFPLCQKNWFCGKVCLDGFYPLLRSKSSSWIHIVIKRIFQACCPHHLKNMEKIVKHNFGGAGGGGAAGSWFHISTLEVSWSLVLFLNHVSKSYNFDGNTDNIHSKVVLNSAMDTPLYMQEIPFV